LNRINKYTGYLYYSTTMEKVISGKNNLTIRYRNKANKKLLKLFSIRYVH